MMNVGSLTVRYRCSTLSLCGASTFGVALLAIPYAPSAGWLALTVLFAGAGFGTLDVAMNIAASALERRAGRHLMSSFHAIFSIGNLAGAFAVGQILSRGGALAICLGATGLGVVVLAIAASLGMSPTVEQASAPRWVATQGAALDRARGPISIFSAP
ncbi:MAG: hypothetical protein WBA15_18795 [Mesorhizobium sp.]